MGAKSVGRSDFSGGPLRNRRDQQEYTMPKIKSNRGAAKRFRVTGSGRIKRKHAFHSHILTKKDTKRKRRLRSTSLIAGADEKAIRKLLPKL